MARHLDAPAAAAARSPRRRVLRWVALGVLALAVTAPITWKLTGGSWVSIETPSMGQAAPVGTLALVQPAEVSDLAVGDVITFQPPVDGAAQYTHRVIAIGDGQVETQGDINGAKDPWVVTDEDLRGRAVALLAGVAWLVKMLPILVPGIIGVVLAARHLVSRPWRMPLRLTGIPLVIAIASAVYRPFVGMQLIGSAPTAAGASATVVSTGLLPIKVAAAEGTSAHLVSGQVGTVSGTDLDELGRLTLNSGIDLTPGWLILVIAVCAVPLVAALFTPSDRATRVASA